MNDTISRQAAIDEIARWVGYLDEDMIYRIQTGLKRLPFAQSETYKEKLNEIASALSEKFAYMNTCLNERDIILGYLGVKRSCETHCNTNCTNTKCESHPSFAQSERKKGKWIVHYECPKCGEITKDFMEYCPFCGADLREEGGE